MNRLTNKVIIVTGGSPGIGREACKMVTAEGVHIDMTDIIDDEGEKLRDEIGKEGGSARYWHLDVSRIDGGYTSR